jgi:hypothetical protein
MAAQEQEGERVVVGRGFLDWQLQGGRGLLSPAPGALTAPLVNQAPGGDGNEPGSRVAGRTCLRPLEGGREQGLLHGVLASVELPVAPNQGGEDLRRQLTQQVLCRRLLRD